MTKLISGRVKKIPSANVSASRYDFIKLSETEPDLGVPAANGYVLSGNVDGRRAWVLPTADLSATSINALADVDTATVAPILGYGLIWNGTTWVPNVITVSSTELSNVANTVLGIVQSSLVSSFAANSNIANIALTANIANTVLTLSNFTTANLAEGTNLYFTNARVYANVIGLLNAKANVVDLTTANVIESASNLYYTNARAILNVIPAVTQLVITTPVFNYNIDQYSGDNPTIYVSAGETISFVLNQSASHPLNIRVSNGGSNYNTGLTHVADDGTITTDSSANNKVGGKLFWKIPYSLAGSTYVYQCTNHSSMVGNIVIQKPVSTVTTTDVVEGNNLYFTNARVYSNVLALLPTLAGDNILIAANGRISANAAGLSAGLSGSISTLTGNISILGNLSVRDRIATNILSTNSLIVNGFEIFSNNDISINKITSNVSILGNITANSLITYGNITATGTVTANSFVGTGTGVPTLSSSSNIILSPVGSVIFYNNMIAGTAGNIIGTTSITTNSLSTNSLIVNGYELFSNNDISVNKITANIWTGIFTANVIESASNLYFTNARVYANVIGLIGNKANISDLTTANVVEVSSNLYFTNARVYSNVLTLLPTLAGDNILIEANGRISASGITSIVTSVVGSLTTANVTEVASNLYYTNTRSRAAISAGAGILYDPATGVIASLQNTSSASNVTFAQLNVTGNVNFYGNVTTHGSNNLSISDNMIYLNSGSSTSNPDLGFAGNYNDGSYKHTGFFRDATDGVWKVFDSYTPEPDASQFIDTTHGSFRLANVSATAFIGNVVGTVSSISNFSTTSLSEGTNLYYTNARVASNVIALLPVYNGAILASNVTTTSLTANTINVTAIYGSATGGSITGADLISANNITATNITASYIVTGSGPGGSLTGANLLSSNNISSLNWIGLYASNVIESGNTTSGNVFFSNARAIGAFVAGSGINIAANGQISASASSSATSIVGLNTANVSESASNLYFTNTRAIGAFVAGSGINIAANGQISATISSLTATAIVGLNTANVSESASNLYYTNARVYANVVSLLTNYTGNISAGNISTGGATGGFITGANLISANNFISTGGFIGANLISANNITTTNITTGNLYTGSGSGGFITGANLITSNNITVTNLTATNLNIIGGITDNSGILSIATTGGTNANIELTADGTGRIGLDGMYWPNADGTVGQVLQTSGTGDLSWATPSAGGGGGQTQLSITNSQILSGGNQNYTLSNSANSANTVLVTINGLVQAPITDYTISGLTGLVFAANTPANATIEVKTFGYSAVDPNDVILKQLVRSASYAFSRIFY